MFVICATTDSSEDIVSETRLATGTMFTDKLFTGQREMAGLGIYHYGARFYSPKLGRFLSADSFVPGFANPQNLNRYSYVGNSPLNYIDPTGHMRLEEGPQNDRFRPSVYDDYEPRDDREDEDDIVLPQINIPRPTDTPTPTNTPTVTPTGTPSNPTSTPQSPSLIPTPAVTTLPTPTLPSSTWTQSPFTQSSSNGPDWGNIAAGIGIIVVVDLLVVVPLVVGLTAFAPELEVAMILTEAWSWPLAAGIITANVYGWNLIVEGAQGN